MTTRDGVNGNMKMSLRKIENIHVALWLLKDASWCMSWRYFGMFMVIPTLAVACHLTWHARKVTEELVRRGPMDSGEYYLDVWGVFLQ